ncbi:ATP-binding protein [Geitlerinema sp. PCC 9228]|jgi:two-component system sensor histidine kinase/response regulator|uniref:hybrid sensor histidine kinase/response regulator n=1 Tax=Geitlerinema sp. PCC 9228 TaxID=111611 RepID=UPI0008F9C191|nr:ATP-binding protein [Geitlerinema sp. PCC 9228]
MPSSTWVKIQKNTTVATYNHLQEHFYRMASQVKAEVLTDDMVAWEGTVASERFLLLVSQPLAALLVASDLANQQNGATAAIPCQVSLSLNRHAIADFITQRLPSTLSHPQSMQSLLQTLHAQECNDPNLESELLLQLAADPQEIPHQVRQREAILQQLTSQIQQNRPLPAIFDTATTQLRSYLQCDRVLIYQQEKAEIAGESYPATGNIAAWTNLPSTLQQQYVRRWQQCYQSKSVTPAENNHVSLPTSLSSSEGNGGGICTFKNGIDPQIQAELVVPIAIEQQTWGYLVAQQSHPPQPWQDTDKTFCQQIAQQLAIAISQNTLSEQLQHTKNHLEQRAIERTQELHDALLLAQSANLAKSEFLATMSHELRTPLTCVMGMSATLLRWSSSQLTERQREYLRTIYKSGEHLLELIEDILELSELESGKAVLDLREISIFDIARQSLKTVSEQIANGGVRVNLDLKRQSIHNETMIADPWRLTRILYNLLSNAIKFTPKQGEVTLRVWQETEETIFQVEDTGIGIPEHQIPLLFQKFQQLDASYNRQYGGTGLGLALTKQLVEMHGGSIQVESTVGIGSTFTVRLPHRAGIPKASKKPEPPIGASLPSDRPQGKIILIEEREEDSTPICDLLTAAGYQVVCIVDSSMVIEQIQLVVPDALIVSADCSQIEVEDIIESLRQLPVGENLKILLLAETEIPNPRETCRHLGADDYLLKPIQPYQLLHKLNALELESTAASESS